MLITADHPDPAALRGLVDAATRADGVEPVGEHVLLHARRADDTATNLLARDGSTLVGFAHLDGEAAELAVHPGHRRRGVGSALVSALEERTGRLSVWAHGRRPAAVAFAAVRGYVESRVLLQLGRSLTDPPLPELDLPAGVRLRPFVVGQDEEAWLAVNRRAFADHPEQGRWTPADVRDREAEPWFDPAGFLLAVREDDGALVGFHWTKVHDEQTGEVYVIAVDPAAQGHHLGPALTVAGLHHLAGRGLERVLLYADADNVDAVHMYQKLGFTRWRTDVQFTRAPLR